MPETKRLTLEEMDILFGSAGVAVADQERMQEIHREIGLDSLTPDTRFATKHDIDIISEKDNIVKHQLQEVIE